MFVTVVDPIMLNLDSDPWLIGYGVNWLNFAQTVLKSVGGKTFLSIFKNTTKIMALEEIFYQLGLWMVNFIFNLTPFASYLSYFHLCISNLDPDSQQWGVGGRGTTLLFIWKLTGRWRSCPACPPWSRHPGSPAPSCERSPAPETSWWYKDFEAFLHFSQHIFVEGKYYFWKNWGPLIII